MDQPRDCWVQTLLGLAGDAGSRCRNSQPRRASSESCSGGHIPGWASRPGTVWWFLWGKLGVLCWCFSRVRSKGVAAPWFVFVSHATNLGS